MSHTDGSRTEIGESGEYLQRVKQDTGAAQAYRWRKPRRHRAEMVLIDRAFRLIPKECRILDIPAGAGRVTIRLTRAGWDCSGGELGDAMIDVARQAVADAGLDCPIEKQDLGRMSYADRAFDCVVCFRMFHHYSDTQKREQTVRELCRVAARYVVISYLSPFALTSFKRRMRSALGGRRSRQHTTPLAEVKGYFSTQGFDFVADFAQMPLLHTLQVAVFRRATAT